MKIKEITIGGSYTYQPAAYHSARAEATFTVELDDDEDPDAAQDELRQQIVNSIVHTLAGVDEVHNQVFKKGMNPKDLIKESNEGDMFEDEEWNP